MRLSRTSGGMATALLFLSVVLAGTYAQKAERPALRAGQDAETPSHPNRQPRNSGIQKSAKRPRDANAPPWQPGPIPATVSVNVRGVARDEAGRAIAGAAITLYAGTDKGAKAAGTTTADAEGRYIIHDATLPVRTSISGHRLPTEITPYAEFSLSGLSPGLGIAWSLQQSMYALKEPHPDDIQRRLPLGGTVVLDLTFPKAATLEGKVVDEDSRPVEGAKLQVMHAALLDEAGHETNNRQGYDNWRALPGTVGRAVTGRDGSFRIKGLPDRACFWISVNRPEPDNAMLGFYAATIDGPDTFHQKLAPAGFTGGASDEVKTNPITLTFPKTRPIVVTVVDDHTGKPVARAGVYTLGESLATRFRSGGETDAAGKVQLSLPPGRYKGIRSDPPIETNYIRTNQGPLVVERGDGPHHYEIRQKAGVEVIFQAVGVRGDEPIAGAFFWKAPEDQPEATEQIQTSTFEWYDPWTDTKGEMRAVLTPEPGRRYRFRFAGIHESNTPPASNPEMANKHGYEAFPTQSAPVELVAGKTIRLRFVLHKRD
ncbi:MAG: hypothetical protein ACLQIB_18160 [Isosphaeraceae bacterium]